MSARSLTEPSEIGAQPSTIRVDLAGRFMLPSKREHDCQIVAMSTTEMRVASDATPRLGDQVIVYIAELGRFEGVVERHEDDGFSLGMTLPPLKYEKLADQLQGLASRGDDLDPQIARRHKRFVPLTRVTTVRLPNGKERMARINDLSASGVNVEFNFAVSKMNIPEGGKIFIGSKSATVLRTFEGGFVAEFDDAFEEESVNERTTL